MIAIPTYPYDPHSVWNRNQLGALDSTGVGTLIAVGLTAYVLMQFMKRARR